MDILLPILPTLNNTLIPSVGSTPALASATSILPQLMNLPNATILHGIVSTPRNALGHIVIATDKGELALKTDIFMRRGMDIMIRLDKSTDELMAKIITIDGKSVGKYIENLQYAALQEEQDSVGGRIPLLTEEMPEDGTGIQQRTITIIKQHFDPQKPQVLRAILMSIPTPPPVANAAMPATPPATNSAAENPQLPANTPPTTPTPFTSQPNTAPPPSGTQFSLRIMALQLPQQPPLQMDTLTPLPPALLKSLPQPQIQPLNTMALSNIQEQSPDIQAQPAPTPSLIFTPPPPSHANATAAYQQLQTSFPPHAPQSAAKPAFATIPTPTTIPTPVSRPSETLITPSPPMQPPAIPQVTSAAPDLMKMLPPNTFPAQVIDSTAEGDITLHTNMGTMRLFSPTPLPMGTLLLLEINDIKSPLPIIPQGIENALPASNPDEQAFTGLTALASLLAQPSTTMERYQISPIPREGKELVTDMLFFLSALKGGEMNKWLGEKNTRSLQQKKYGDLLERISTDFQTIKPATVADTPASATNWQQYTIPLLLDGHLAALQLLHRRHHYEQEQKNTNEEPIKNQSDHFVLGITLTHFGELQLDGFVKKPLQTTATKINFELIIRSHIPLPEDVQSDIRVVFQNAQEITGCTGSLQFRHGQGACLNLDSVTKPASPPKDMGTIIA